MEEEVAAASVDAMAVAAGREVVVKVVAASEAAAAVAAPLACDRLRTHDICIDRSCLPGRSDTMEGMPRGRNHSQSCWYTRLPAAAAMAVMAEEEEAVAASVEAMAAVAAVAAAATAVASGHGRIRTHDICIGRSCLPGCSDTIQGMPRTCNH